MAEAQHAGVLVLAPTGRDAELTCALLREAGIHCQACGSMRELCEHLADADMIVVGEEALDEPSLRCMENALAGNPPWSDIPVLVLAARNIAAEVSRRTVDRLGARAIVTIQERPVRRFTLLSAIRSGLRARQRQYEVRDLVGRLEAAVQDRDRFLAMLGHELRNPLTAIRHAVEVNGTQADPGWDQERLAIIQRQARQLTRLIDDLLDVSRITAGKVALRKRPLDVRDIMALSLETTSAVMAEQQHEVHVDLGDRSLPVEADPVRLDQIFTNLLTNAAKYTPAGGRIDVTARRERHPQLGEQAVVRVRDTGIGLSHESLEHVFGLFMQADHSLERSQGGLGLGLAVVKSLVEMHGGAAWAESEGLGKGSTFSIRLPLRTSRAPAEKAAESLSVLPGRTRRVLLVEDSADTRAGLQRLLAGWGHEVQVAADGAEGRERAIDWRPEVALVDIGLPGMDGYEVARRVRAALGQDVFLIAMTGYGQPEDRDRALAAGFDLHLVKPVEPDILRKVLAGKSGTA